jgi:4-hydroxythreonine-4-phosphate dehydrogenase
LTAVPALGTLVATGGETARAALEARGVRTLRVWAELEPGVPVGTTPSPRPLRVVTKAGGFGDAGTLARVRTALRSAPARSLVR